MEWISCRNHQRRNLRKQTRVHHLQARSTHSNSSEEWYYWKHFPRQTDMKHTSRNPASSPPQLPGTFPCISFPFSGVIPAGFMKSSTETEHTRRSADRRLGSLPAQTSLSHDCTKAFSGSRSFWIYIQINPLVFLRGNRKQFLLIPYQSYCLVCHLFRPAFFVLLTAHNFQRLFSWNQSALPLSSYEAPVNAFVRPGLPRTASSSLSILKFPVFTPARRYPKSSSRLLLNKIMSQPALIA